MDHQKQNVQHGIGLSNLFVAANFAHGSIGVDRAFETVANCAEDAANYCAVPLKCVLFLVTNQYIIAILYR